jgi:hypothetical protein
MILDKNGKLFGKISIVDIAVILVVLAVIVGVFVRFAGSAGKAVTKPTKIEYVVKIENIRKSSVEALEKKGIVTDKKSETAIGEITNVEVQNVISTTPAANGKIVSATVPERYTALVTVEADGKEGESGYFDAQNNDISVGHTASFYTKYVATTGTIQSINQIK